jgi:iron complex outermembrane recepter protein
VRNSLVPFTIQGRTYFRNAARATHQGVEWGATYAPIPAIWINTAYTYTDPRYDEYTDRFNVSHADNRVPGVAPHRFESVVTYAPRPAAWYASIENRYVARYSVNDANALFSPSYLLTDLRGGIDGLRLGSVRLDPFVGVSNLLDREYNAAVTVNDANSRFFESGPGRSVYVGGSARASRR